MVPKKDRASGGAAIGVAFGGTSGLVAFRGLLVVASILTNWNHPLLLPFQNIYIYIYTFTEYDIFPPPKESMLCVGVMHPTTMAPVQRRAPSRYQAGFSSDRSLF